MNDDTWHTKQEEQGSAWWMECSCACAGCSRPGGNRWNQEQKKETESKITTIQQLKSTNDQWTKKRGKKAKADKEQEHSHSTPWSWRASRPPSESPHHTAQCPMHGLVWTSQCDLIRCAWCNMNQVDVLKTSIFMKVPWIRGKLKVVRFYRSIQSYEKMNVHTDSSSCLSAVVSADESWNRSCVE